MLDLYRIRTTLLALTLAAGLFAFGCDDDADGGDTPADDTGVADTGDAGGDTAADAGDAGDAGPGEGPAIEGLSGPVEATIDSNGVLHVQCETDLDCFAAQGWFHAHHRFFQMDLVRRQSRGRLATVIGELGLEGDVRFRHILSTRDGDPLTELFWENSNAETRALLEAYTRGVNAWLADLRAERNGARLSTEYDFPLVQTDAQTIPDWEPQDSIAMYLNIVLELAIKTDDELLRGRAIDELGAETALDLFTIKPGVASYTYGAAGATPTGLDASGLTPDRVAFGADYLETLRRARPAIDQAHAYLGGLEPLSTGTGEDLGSNNWVVSGSRSQSGNALLANDPHLSLLNPALWYVVELDAKTGGSGDLHIGGFSLPALPGIIIGQNEHIAWGLTVARHDLADAYIETLSDDGSAVVVDGTEVPLVSRDIEFGLAGGATRTRTLEWVPHHGPLIAKDEAAGTGVSINWSAYERGTDLNSLYSMIYATDAADAISRMDELTTPNQNFVIVDTGGTIAWYPYSLIPNRPWADADTQPWLPLPGDGSAEWDGYMTPEQIPKIVDPPNGFIATANQYMTDAAEDMNLTNDAHPLWQHHAAPGYRHKRIVDLLETIGTDHTPETMTAIQGDDYSLFGELVLPHVLDAAAQADSLPQTAQKMIGVLEVWDYACPTGLEGLEPDSAKAADPDLAASAIGCAAFHVLLPALLDGAFADELDPMSDYAMASLRTPQIVALHFLFDKPGELAGGQVYFDDVETAEVETATDVTVAALAEAGRWLEDNLGDDVDEWRWGRIHTVTLASLFSSAGVKQFDHGPWSNDGGLFTVDVANPIGFGGDYSHPNGASVRLVSEATPDGVVSWFQLPGGQSNHRDSPYYNSLLDEYLNNTPTRLLFEPGEVAADAAETYTVQPAP